MLMLRFFCFSDLLLFVRLSGFGPLTLPQKDVKAPIKTKRDNFDQGMAGKAPVAWSKYTTVLKNLEFCTLSDFLPQCRLDKS